MKLTVKNFGPIKSAKVDIKPMTVFVGHSNTGKSYLAILIYTIAKVLKSHEQGEFAYLALANLEVEEREEEGTIEGIIADSQKCTDLTEKIFLEYLESIREVWKDEALRCFGEEWENIIKSNGDLPSIVISGDNSEITLDLLSAGEDRSLLLDFIVKKISKRIPSQSKRKASPIEPMESVFELVELILSEISNLFSLSANIPQPTRRDLFMYRGMSKSANTHYLPAVRGGLMQSHRILVSAVIARAPTIGLTGAEIVPFTGVLADFLEKLLMITDDRGRDPRDRRRSKNTRNISQLSKAIEQKIMHGAIETEPSETHHPDFRYQFADKNDKSRGISLMHASSSVSELAPIVLFIRYYLSPGDVFIVEEPEAHLHPEAQQIIARVLVELVNAGVYVIVTTHSDIILEQISNYVHASKIEEKIDKQALDTEKISAYLFRRARKTKHKNTIVKEISFNAVTGFLTEDHLDVFSSLYNETVGLLNKRDNND